MSLFIYLFSCIINKNSIMSPTFKNDNDFSHQTWFNFLLKEIKFNKIDKNKVKISLLLLFNHCLNKFTYIIKKKFNDILKIFILKL